MSTIKAMAAEMKAEKPPLVPNTPLYPIYATPIIKRNTDRPTETYLDVTFMDKKSDGIAVTEIDAIIFKNFYTASLTISTLVDKAGGTYVPVLENRTIMPSPYFENNSQSWVTIFISEFNSNYSPGKPLRFTLIQPSPVWKDFEICHVCAVGKVPPSGPGVLAADGGISGTGADAQAAWRNRSLSSLIKADSTFLSTKTNLLLEKAQREDHMQAVFPKGQKGSAVPALGKTQMAKKKNETKKAGLSLPGGGGTRKEVAVLDDDQDLEELEPEPDDLLR